MYPPDAPLPAKRAGILIFWCLILGSWLAAAVAHADPTFPPLTGRVVDDANVLSPETRSDLQAALARHQRVTGDQVLVVTLPSLQGYPIEQYGYQLGRAWGIGEKNKNNGVLLIIAPGEHRVRIEVGYGLEGKLTDADSRVIIERDILPAFRRGDFDAGVRAGTASILTILGGDTPEPAKPGRADSMAWLPRTATSSPLFLIGIAVLGLEALVLFFVWLIRLFYSGLRADPTNRRSALGDQSAAGTTNRERRRSRDYLGGGYLGGGFPPDGGFEEEGGSDDYGGFGGGGGSFGGGGASGDW